MSVLTEVSVRNMVRDNKITDILYLDKEQIITPSAKTYLSDKNITIKYINSNEVETTPIEVPTQFKTLFGAILDEKPEYMTHLRGDTLVFKDHPRIAFRGAIDSLEADILSMQVNVLDKSKLVEDLQEILLFTRKLLKCEVGGKPVGEFTLLGLNSAEIREHSHHTNKYYGIAHFLPDYTQGAMVIGLNKLRTKVREVELIAYKAFSDQYNTVERADIIKALNRLSSAFWIMMVKCVAKQY
ncbi:MAG: hypothetical protein BEN19_06605 [Epulopiscium sp. Nuni2H_MBin003]|nr:MAG: hypothetical protein BEN19_06605 [Epulopiscium sp. Nuni2H_MBin003]